MLVVLLAATPAAGDPADGGSADRADAGASWYQVIHVHGWVDANFSLNSNRPDDHESFEPGTGTTGKRASEFSLNVAALDVSVDPAPVGFHITLADGSSMAILRAAELSGAGIGPEVWSHLYQANVSVTVPVGRGLLLLAGIYASQVGFETFFTKDNWNYTHGWLGELSPYYQTGVMAQYAFTDHFSAQLHVINGWSLIGDNNSAKTIGTQLAWTSDRFDLSFNTLLGPELPGDDSHWRFYGDIVAELNPTGRVQAAAELDAGLQQRPAANDAHWEGVGGFLRIAPIKLLAVALRAEYFHDPDAVISPARQSLAEGTVTLELRPWDPLSFKLEGRYDYSTSPLFTGRDGTGRNDQFLAIAGAVAAF